MVLLDAAAANRWTVANATGSGAGEVMVFILASYVDLRVRSAWFNVKLGERIGPKAA